MPSSAPTDALHAPARLKALAQAGFDCEGTDPAMRRLAKLAGRLLDVPVALATAVNPAELIIKGAHGLPHSFRPRVPIAFSLCQHVVAQNAPLAIPDVQADLRGRHLPSEELLSPGAYLGYPLRAPDGQPLGALCVLAPTPHDWTDHELALLGELAEAGRGEFVARRERDRRNALRAIDGASFLANADGLVTWIGAGWQAQTGQPLGQALGDGWLQAIHPEDRAHFLEGWRAAVARRRPFAREFRVVPSGGSARRIALQATPSVENGLLAAYVGRWADVEPKRKAEEAAARAEALVEGVFAAAPLAMGVIEVRPARLVDIRHNPASEALAGTAGVALWDAGSPELGLSAAATGSLQWVEACHRVVRSGQPVSFDYHLSRPGRLVVLSVKVTPAGTAANGRPLCAYFAEDVTEEYHQKRRLDRSEEHLQLALDSARMGTWGWDLRSGTLDWSAQMLALCGLDSFDGSVGSALAAIYQPDRGRYLRTVSAAVEQARRDVSDAALRLEFRVTGGGTTRWIRISGRVYVGASGVPERMAGVATDVTDEVETAKALLQASESAHAAAEQARRAQARAEEAARLKESILNNMSHEIRTPLTTVIGYADLLAEESEGADAELVAAIDRGAKRLLSTLNSVLDLARLESGVAVRRDRLDLCGEAQEAVRLFEERARRKGLLLVLDAPENPIWVVADKGGIQRTLANLLSNALKFTDHGSVRVRVRGSGAVAMLEVTDTGVGMSPEFVPSAFEPFRQESEGVGRIHEGTGIGLSIVRQIIALMGGTIEAESVLGSGTTFRCTLPAEAKESHPAKAVGSMPVDPNLNVLSQAAHRSATDEPQRFQESA